MVAAALSMPSAALASGLDPMRCEAAGMRKEGQRYECLGRCERRAERLGALAESRLTACRSDCEARFDEAMDQLDQRDICSLPVPEPDPNRCQARLMRIGASRLICKSQCVNRTGESGDGAACAAACDAQCLRAADRILARDFCLGHGEAEVCTDHPTRP
jgi:hypothetical protein